MSVLIIAKCIGCNNRVDSDGYARDTLSEIHVRLAGPNGMPQGVVWYAHWKCLSTLSEGYYEEAPWLRPAPK